jgi:hypothetical protein
MTVTFTDIRPDVPCEMSGQTLENDRAIAIDVRAEMPTTVDPEFHSPFRSFPWSTFSSDNRFTGVMEKGCGGDYSSNDLMNEFPGGYAEATVYLDVPADVRSVVFEPDRDTTYLIEVTDPPDAPVSQSQSAAAVAPAATSAPAAPSAPAALPAPSVSSAPPVMGFTEAPGHGVPTPMSKVVSHCGDPMIHQPGTTFFTDGSTGWTQSCAAQMG